MELSLRKVLSKGGDAPVWHLTIRGHGYEHQIGSKLMKLDQGPET